MVAETSDSRSWVEGFRGVRNSVGGLGLRGLGLLKLTGCAFLVGSRRASGFMLRACVGPCTCIIQCFGCKVRI